MRIGISNTKSKENNISFMQTNLTVAGQDLTIHLYKLIHQQKFSTTYAIIHTHIHTYTYTHP